MKNITKFIKFVLIIIVFGFVLNFNLKSVHASNIQSCYFSNVYIKQGLITANLTVINTNTPVDVYVEYYVQQGNYKYDVYATKYQSVGSSQHNYYAYSNGTLLCSYHEF